MTPPFAKMTIECSAPGCGHRFADRNRASLISALGADLGAVEVNARQEGTTKCPECGLAIEFGLLMLDDDGVWRVSPFAGHAHDVTVLNPPGGAVSYGAPEAGTPGEPSAQPPAAKPLSPNEAKVRDRALAVIEGHAAHVSLAAQRDAVELALEAGVLDDEELAGARGWLERRPR